MILHTLPSSRSQMAGCTPAAQETAGRLAQGHVNYTDTCLGGSNLNLPNDQSTPQVIATLILKTIGPKLKVSVNNLDRSECTGGGVSRGDSDGVRMCLITFIDWWLLFESVTQDLFFNEVLLQIIQLSRGRPSPLVSAPVVCVIHTSTQLPDCAAWMRDARVCVSVC